MISYKAKKNRSKRDKVNARRIKQFCKTLLVASCGLMPMKDSFAQSTIQLGTNAGVLAQPVDSLVAIGVNAGRLNQGGRHIFIGTNAGYNLNHESLSTLGNGGNYATSNSPSSGIYIGYYAGYHTTTGLRNLFIGDQAGYRNTTGSSNTFIGNLSGLNNTGSDNTFIGYRAGVFNTTGFDNTFIGEDAGVKNTTGDNNTFVGEDVGANNTTGSDNAFFGTSAGHDNTTGYRNAFFGNYAGYDNETGHHNTALGDSSLTDTGKGRYNTAVGAGTGANNEHASYNTFLGMNAGWDNNRTNSTSSSNAWRNTYVGAFAGFTNREGTDNVGMGCRADFVVGAGTGTSYGGNISNTVFLGSYASVAADGVVALGKSSSGSGTNGIALGHQSSVTAANAIAIGYQASVTTANEVQIGNSAITSIGGSVNWTATSDGRFKTDVQENVIGLDFINKLRPVTYQFDSKKIMEHKGQSIPADLDSAFLLKNQIRYTGFIAQEVNQAAKDANFNFSGVDKKVQAQVSDTSKVSDTYGLRYAEFVVPLVKATQELSQKVEDLENLSRNLAGENATQKDLLAKYEAALESALVRLEALENEKAELANQ